VRELAETIRDASGPVVALGKSAFYAQIDRDQTQAYDFAKEVMSRNALEADAQEGMSAFLERRPPVWKR
jgi:enoyl-CoA hydratase/carnithine racemase